MIKKGFTIVESLVAIAVLLLVISAPLTLAERSLASADFASEQVVATYLAQEGIEFIRNLRDTNVVAGREWLAGLESCVGGKICGVDPTNQDTQKQVAVCGPLNDSCTLWQHKGIAPYESLGRLFGHPQNRGSGEVNQWERSPFKRVISIAISPDEEEAKITATMSWVGDGFGERSVIVSANLMHWYAQ